MKLYDFFQTPEAYIDETEYVVFIGLGGEGSRIIEILNKIFSDHIKGLQDKSDEQKINHVRFIRIDADVSHTTGVDKEERGLFTISLNSNISEIKNILNNNYYKERDTYSKGFFVKNIPEELPNYDIEKYLVNHHSQDGFATTPVLGRLYFLIKYHILFDRLKTHLKNFKSDRKIRVFIVSSSFGGTGSGMFIDMPILIRWVFHELGFEKPAVYGFLIDADFRERRDLFRGNTYSLLKELINIQTSIENYTVKFINGRKAIDILYITNSLPFDFVFFANKPENRNISLDEIREITAKILYLINFTEVKRIYQRFIDTPRLLTSVYSEKFKLSSYNLAVGYIPKEKFLMSFIAKKFADILKEKGFILFEDINEREILKQFYIFKLDKNEFYSPKGLKINNLDRYFEEVLISTNILESTKLNLFLPEDKKKLLNNLEKLNKFWKSLNENEVKLKELKEIVKEKDVLEHIDNISSYIYLNENEKREIIKKFREKLYRLKETLLKEGGFPLLHFFFNEVYKIYKTKRYKLYNQINSNLKDLENTIKGFLKEYKDSVYPYLKDISENTNNVNLDIEIGVVNVMVEKEKENEQIIYSLKKIPIQLQHIIKKFKFNKKEPDIPNIAINKSKISILSTTENLLNGLKDFLFIQIIDELIGELKKLEKEISEDYHTYKEIYISLIDYKTSYLEINKYHVFNVLTKRESEELINNLSNELEKSLTEKIEEILGFSKDGNKVKIEVRKNEKKREVNIFTIVNLIREFNTDFILEKVMDILKDYLHKTSNETIERFFGNFSRLYHFKEQANKYKLVAEELQERATPLLESSREDDKSCLILPNYDGTNSNVRINEEEEIWLNVISIDKDNVVHGKYKNAISLLKFAFGIDTYVEGKFTDMYYDYIKIKSKGVPVHRFRNSDFFEEIVEEKNNFEINELSLKDFIELYWFALCVSENFPYISPCKVFTEKIDDRGQKFHTLTYNDWNKNEKKLVEEAYFDLYKEKNLDIDYFIHSLLDDKYKNINVNILKTIIEEIYKHSENIDNDTKKLLLNLELLKNIISTNKFNSSENLEIIEELINSLKIFQNNNNSKSMKIFKINENYISFDKDWVINTLLKTCKNQYEIEYLEEFLLERRKEKIFKDKFCNQNKENKDKNVCIKDKKSCKDILGKDSKDVSYCKEEIMMLYQNKSLRNLFIRNLKDMLRSPILKDLLLNNSEIKLSSTIFKFLD